MHIFTVTRKDKGVRVERRKQYKYENLAEKFIHKKAEPFIVTVKPRNDESKPFNQLPSWTRIQLCNNGSLKMYIHDNEIVLEKGIQFSLIHHINTQWKL